MKHNELVTVFIPIYNSEKYIKETLKSIINQTYDNLEILIIDDGSTDRSLEIINEFKDKRIKILKNETNKGIPYTRNRGLKNSNGKYIAIMDSDDISMKDRIEKQVNYLQTHPNIDLVSSNIKKFSNNRFENFIYRIHSEFKKYLNDTQVKYNMIFSNPIPNTSVMIRKETIEKLNLRYDEKFFVAQDYNFWVDMILSNCKLIVMKDVLLEYRTGHMNITKFSSLNKKNIRKEIIFNIKDKMLNYYKIELSDYEKRMFFEFFGEERIEKINEIYIEKIIEILEKIKYSSEIIDKETFQIILQEKVKISLSKSKLTLKEKVSYYKRIAKNYELKDKIYIIIAHFIEKIIKN